MRILKYDDNMGLNPVLHLQSETLQEQLFFNKLWFEGVVVVSYNGSDKISITNAELLNERVKSLGKESGDESQK